SGCETSATFVVTEPFPLILSPTIENPICHGSSNGLIDALVEGGTSPYQYNWSNGSQDHLQQNLISDAYSVTVTDANGCTTGGSFFLTQPEPITITAVLQPTSCEGLPSGAINLSV